MKSKLLRFSLTAIWVVFSRAYDAYCTAQYTPDLTMEANPLVSVLGFGWTPLLAVVGGLTLFTVYAHWKRAFQTEDIYPKSGEYSLLQFNTYLYRGRNEHWSTMLYKPPGSWKRFVQYWGMFATPGLIWAGVISTIMWLLINNTTWYMPDYHSVRSIYLLVIGSSLAAIVSATAKARDEYRLKLADRPDTHEGRSS